MLTTRSSRNHEANYNSTTVEIQMTTPQALRRLQNINEIFTQDEEVVESSFIRSNPNGEYCITLVRDAELFGVEDNIKVSGMHAVEKTKE